MKESPGSPFREPTTGLLQLVTPPSLSDQRQSSCCRRQLIQDHEDSENFPVADDPKQQLVLKPKSAKSSKTPKKVVLGERAVNHLDLTMYRGEDEADSKNVEPGELNLNDVNVMNPGDEEPKKVVLGERDNLLNHGESEVFAASFEKEAASVNMSYGVDEDIAGGTIEETEMSQAVLDIMEHAGELPPYHPVSAPFSPRPKFMRLKRAANKVVEEPEEPEEPAAPYDPEYNPLSPRPEFLRYNPEKHLEFLDNLGLGSKRALFHAAEGDEEVDEVEIDEVDEVIEDMQSVTGIELLNLEELPPLENNNAPAESVFEEVKVADDTPVEISVQAESRRGRIRWWGWLRRALMIGVVLACVAGVCLFVRGNYELLKDIQQKVLFQTWEWTADDDHEITFPGSWDTITTVSNQSLLAIPDLSREFLLTPDEVVDIDGFTGRDEVPEVEEGNTFEDAVTDERDEVPEDVDTSEMEDGDTYEDAVEDLSGACSRQDLDESVLQMCLDRSVLPTRELQQEVEISSAAARSEEEGSGAAGDGTSRIAETGTEEGMGFVVDREFFDDPVETGIFDSDVSERKPDGGKAHQMVTNVLNSISSSSVSEILSSVRDKKANAIASFSALGIASTLIFLLRKKRRNEMAREQLPLAAEGEGGEAHENVPAVVDVPVQDDLPAANEEDGPAYEDVYVISRPEKGGVKADESSVSGTSSSGNNSSENVYGSFTVMEQVDLGGQVKVTPVRRSSRIRSRSMHSPLLRS